MRFKGLTSAEVVARDRKLALEAEREEIQKTLLTNELAALRPLRAIGAKKDTAEDNAKIIELDTAAALLRARKNEIDLELKAL